MRSLFLKIFLWFWVAMALVSITLILSELFSDTRSSQARDDAVDRTMTPLIADNFIEIYDTQGKAGLSAFLSRSESSFPWTPYLFDANGNEVSGRKVSPDTRQAYELAPRNGQTEIIHRGDIFQEFGFLEITNPARLARRVELTGQCVCARIEVMIIP